MSHLRTKTARIAALALLGAALLTGCGSSDKGSDAPAKADSTAPLYKDLPADIQKAGTIVVGSDIAYAPMEYYDTDGTTVLGFDKELTDLMAKQLGVTFTWENAVFDTLIPALDSGRIDVAISGMSDTAERQQKIDFVDYYQAGAMLLVKKGNPEGITDMASLCGKKVAVQRGTTQEGYAQEQSAACEADGKPAIDLLSFDRETEAMLQVKNGRAASGMQDYPVATYNARTSGGGNDFEVVGDQIQAGPLGIGVNKDDAQLRDALQKALQAVIDDGSYQKLIEKYQTPLGAVTSATINGGS